MKKRVTVFLLSLLGMNTLFGTGGPISYSPTRWPWFLDLRVRSYWAGSGQTQTINLAPGIVKSYVDNGSSQGLVEGQIFLGIHHQLKDTLYSQLGISFALANDATLSGIIWDDADPRLIITAI